MAKEVDGWPDWSCLFKQWSIQGMCRGRGSWSEMAITQYASQNFIFYLFNIEVPGQGIPFQSEL